MDIHFEVRPVNLSDIAEIVSIEKSIHINPWKEDFFLSELDNEVSVFLVACIDSQLVAYTVSHLVEDELSILNIGVKKDLQGKGYGSMLLEYTLQLASKKGARSAFLEVRESNQVAINFYKSRDFKPIGQRVRYYLDTGENALIYKKSLSSVI